MLNPRSPSSLLGAYFSGCIASLAVLAAACGEDEFVDCNLPLAQELVYSRNGMVATKGQALLHDSCGNGAFCHSSSARGEARQGVPKGLDYDMLPLPTRVKKVVHDRSAIWEQVTNGEMPPRGYTGGENGWQFSLLGDAGVAMLPSIRSNEGRGILRNWLACGAPTVEETRVPEWARAMEREPRGTAWSQTYASLRAGCVSAGCHDGDPTAEEAIRGATPIPFSSGECSVYRWLMYKPSVCGEKMVVPGDLGSPLLLKLQGDPGCVMDPSAPKHNDRVMPVALTEVLTNVTAWVAQGAAAPQCGSWSSDPIGLDGGVASPSWDRLYAEIIGPSCATAGCHRGRSAAMAGNLNLEDMCGARTALLAAGKCGARVVPGQPEASPFIDIVANPTPRCEGTRQMPIDNPLPSVRIEQLRTWVREGAPGGTCR